MIHAVTSSLPWNHVQPSATASSSNAATQGSGAQGVTAEPFFAMLQNLQQTAPATFQKIASTMADRLGTAAQTAAAKGTTAIAGVLNDASQELAASAQNGAIPNAQKIQQELQQAGLLGQGHTMHAPRHANTEGSSSAGTAAVSGFQSSSSSAIQAMLGGALDPQSLATQLFMA